MDVQVNGLLDGSTDRWKDGHSCMGYWMEAWIDEGLNEKLDALKMAVKPHEACD